MFNKITDNTYNDLRKNSLEQWLSDMEKHEDINVRGGVKLTREYIKHLEEEISNLKEENALKNTYLKKAAAKNKN